MYLYLYDYGLDAPRYRRPLARLETRLADLGISGKISRLSPLKNLRDLVRDEVAGGVTTIVAVGNDATVLQVVGEIAARPVSFGIIPIGPGPHQVAEGLGIPEGEAAADTVAARALLPFDLGRANGHYFLSWLTIPPSRVRLAADGHSYSITPAAGNAAVTLCNLRPTGYAGGAPARSFNPHDGILEAYVQPVHGRHLFGHHGSPSQPTVLPFRKLTVLGDSSVQVLTEGGRTLKPPVEVDVLPGKLRVIVGRRRLT